MPYAIHAIDDGTLMDLLPSADAVFFPVIATGIVDLRILPLAGLRRIIGRLDRAPFDNPGDRRTDSRFRAACPEGKLIAGY